MTATASLSVYAYPSPLTRELSLYIYTHTHNEKKISKKTIEWKRRWSQEWTFLGASLEFGLTTA